MSEHHPNFKTVQAEAVELTSYIPNETSGSVIFTVPREWLRKRIENEGEVTLEVFFDVYEWSATEDLYQEAKELGIVLTERFNQ